MTELIRSWIMGLTAAAFLGSIAMALTPKGRPRAVVALVAGLVTVVALIAPLMEFDPISYAQQVTALELSLDARMEEIEEAQERLTSLIISARSEAYILDKAESMGLVGLDIEVVTARNEAGWLFPDHVWITGTVSPAERRALSEFLAGTFGIPADRQYWSEENG